MNLGRACHRGAKNLDPGPGEAAHQSVCVCVCVRSRAAVLCETFTEYDGLKLLIPCRDWVFGGWRKSSEQ